MNAITGAVAGSILQARTINGDVTFTPTRTFLPAQLPAATPLFTNRGNQLHELMQLLEITDQEGPPRLAVIQGDGGSGKTALALHWAHNVRGQFEAGQFWVDLRGSSADASGPLEPRTALERFLRALGTHPDYLPVDVEEQAALWRSAIADRRVLIIADNAASVDQVRPLLPGSGPAVVLVTSRAPLPELAVQGARSIHVGPLDEASAVTLLHRVAGAGRIDAEPQATQVLINRSGRLPLALWALATHLGNHPDRTVAALAESLPANSQTRSETVVAIDETTNTLDTLYDALARPEQELYRLLGFLPGHDFTADTVAGLVGLGIDQTTRRLGRLTDAELVQRRADGRFWLHDRVRHHAYAKAQAAESVHALYIRTRHLAEWYRNTAADAQRTVIPKRWYLGEYRPIMRSFTREEALDWLETERYNLISVQKRAFDVGLHGAAWQIAECMWALFVYRKTYSEWIKACEIGYEAAVAAGDPRAQARMLEGLASAHSSRQAFDTAEDYWRRALKLEEDSEHLEGAATALEGIGVCLLQADPDRAIAFFTRSLGYHMALDRPRGVKLQTRHLGEAHLAAGRYDAAIEQLEKARRIDVGPDEEYLTCRELTPLGQAYLGKGDLDRAGELLNQNLTLTTTIGAEQEHANVLVALADLAHHRGDTATELQHLKQAHPIYAHRGAPQADHVNARIQELGAET